MITYVPPGIEIPWDGIENGARTNNDGHGWAVASKHLGLEVGKSMDSTEAMLDLATARERHGMNSTVIFHSRWGTHGVLGEFNVHPFYVDNDKQTVMAHNGILSHHYHPLKKDPRSDTRIFVDRVAPDFIDNELGIPSRRRGIALGKKIGLGNKLIFMSIKSGEPRVRIINAWLGEWEGGVWYSNSGYKPFRSYYQSGSSGTRWGGQYWDADDWSGEYGGYVPTRRFSTPGFPDDKGGTSSRTPRPDPWVGSDEDDGLSAGEWLRKNRPEWYNEDGKFIWEGTDDGTGEADLGGAQEGLDIHICPFCGTPTIDPLTGLCEACESCVECAEWAGDCQCWRGSHHDEPQSHFELPDEALPLINGMIALPAAREEVTD